MTRGQRDDSQVSNRECRRCPREANKHSAERCFPQSGGGRGYEVRVQKYGFWSWSWVGHVFRLSSQTCDGLGLGDMGNEGIQDEFLVSSVDWRILGNKSIRCVCMRTCTHMCTCVGSWGWCNSRALVQAYWCQTDNTGHQLQLIMHQLCVMHYRRHWWYSRKQNRQNFSPSWSRI